MLELENLDCPICFEPLAPPVFQCSVGHFICPSCCNKHPEPKKCHHCSSTSTYNRCYGIEKVVESIQIPCSNTKYGCTVKTTYHQKEHHKGKCPHAPCFYPETGCSFVGSTGMLLSHFTTEHHWPVITFNYGWLFHAKIQDEVSVLSCEDGRMSLLIVSPERSGSGVSVFCVQPHDVTPKFRCDLQFTFWKKQPEFRIPSAKHQPL